MAEAEVAGGQRYGVRQALRDIEDALLGAGVVPVPEVVSEDDSYGVGLFPEEVSEVEEPEMSVMEEFPPEEVSEEAPDPVSVPGTPEELKAWLAAQPAPEPSAGCWVEPQPASWGNLREALQEYSDAMTAAGGDECDPAVELAAKEFKHQMRAVYFNSRDPASPGYSRTGAQAYSGASSKRGLPAAFREYSVLKVKDYFDAWPDALGRSFGDLSELCDRVRRLIDKTVLEEWPDCPVATRMEMYHKVVNDPEFDGIGGTYEKLAAAWLHEAPLKACCEAVLRDAKTRIADNENRLKRAVVAATRKLANIAGV